MNRDVRRFVDVKQVSEMLCVKPSTVYKWTFEGRIPHYKLHRLVRFIPEEVLEWATKGRWRGNLTAQGRTDEP